MIHAQSVTKSFGEALAVDGLSLHVKKGECFGLLGPNGAGKSTFIGMIYGVVKRTGGNLRVFGLDPATQSRAIKKRLGVVTQDNALDESLSVFDNMSLYAAFGGVPKAERKKRIDDLLDYMNLAHKKGAPINSLSGGMKRRLVFVRALLAEPEILILDEPTTGLDPSVRHLLWGKVKELHDKGTTIVLTTHYMHEAEVLCDRLVIMNQGKIVSEGTPRNMIHQHTPGYVGIYSASEKPRIQKIIHGKPDLHFSEDSSGLYLRSLSMDQLTSLNRTHRIEPLQLRPSNLEDVFLKLTGREITADA